MSKGWRVVVGSDNLGIEYKDELKALLQHDPRVVSVDDVGVVSKSDETAYPHIAVAAARKIAKGEADRGRQVLVDGVHETLMTATTYHKEGHAD